MCTKATGDGWKHSWYEPLCEVNFDCQLVRTRCLRLLRHTPRCLWGCLQKWLDSESSDLIHSLIHWLIQIWEVPGLQKVGPGRRKWVARAVLLKGVCGFLPWPWPVTPLGFLATVMWSALLLHTLQPWCSALPQSRARQPAHHGTLSQNKFSFL